jgi:hypothetical protein
LPTLSRRRRHPDHPVDDWARERAANAALLERTDEELRKGLEVKVAYVGQAVAYGREESDRSTP